MSENSKNNKSRLLSPTERVFIAFDELYTPFVNQFVLEGAGHLDREQWAAAVDKASAANPGSRLLLRGKLSFTRLVDSGVAPRVRIENAERWSGRNPEGAEFLREPLSMYSGPSCEVLLLPGNPARVIFRTHHTVMDGGGTLHWAEDIFRALNGEKLIGSSLGISDIELARSIKTGAFVQEQRIYPAPTGKVQGGDDRITWRRIQITGKHSMLLPKVAKFIALKAAKSPDDAVVMSIPVDMRRRSNAAPSTGNLTGFIRIKITPRTAIEEIAQQIQHRLDQHEYAELNKGVDLCSYMPIAMLRSGLGKAVRTMQSDSLFCGSAILSNLGRLNLPLYTTRDFIPQTGFFIPPGTGASPLFMALAGSESGTELIAAMTESLANNGRLDKLMLELEHFIGGENFNALPR